MSRGGRKWGSARGPVLVVLLACSLTGAWSGAADSIIERHRKEIAEEAARHGGWAAWVDALAPFRVLLQDQLDRYSDAGWQAFEGADRFLFATRHADVLLAETLINHPAGRKKNLCAESINAIVHLDRQLKQRNIALIVVPVPGREEVYPEKLLSQTLPERLIVLPQRLEFIETLLEHDVHAVDLLPALLAEKGKTDPVFAASDAHWVGPGIAASARTLAAELSVYEEDDATKKPLYRRKATQVERHGTLVGWLPTDLQEPYRAGREILPLDRILTENGEPYRPPENAELLMMGDSFVAFMQKSGASITAGLAYEMQQPVSALFLIGNGPELPQALAREGAEYINRRRIIVWLFAARYLIPNESNDWPVVDLPQ